MNNNSSYPVGFIFSHEILFNKRISFKKYCKLILYKREINKFILQKINQLNIPIIQYNNPDKFSYYGLNNFIDLIEKNI